MQHPFQLGSCTQQVGRFLDHHLEWVHLNLCGHPLALSLRHKGLALHLLVCLHHLDHAERHGLVIHALQESMHALVSIVASGIKVPAMPMHRDQLLRCVLLSQFSNAKATATRQPMRQS